jgi:hypothetical protein
VGTVARRIRQPATDDLIEGKTEGRKTKLVASLMLTGGVVAGFFLKKDA